MSTTMKIGEVWRIKHSRKGEFTARILSDPAAEWLSAEIVAGRPKFISAENNILDAGAIGNRIDMRSAFVTPIERVEEVVRS